MQKTEKHCKNQCFCDHKTTKISPKTGPKTQKSASGPGHLRNRKKRCCKPKNWGQKIEKHGVFSLFACRFWTGAFTNKCLPYCFLQCFLKASVTTYQKKEVLAEKCSPPGKPVTFYECHPEDHAPAPSVRADFEIPSFSDLEWNVRHPKLEFEKFIWSHWMSKKIWLKDLLQRRQARHPSLVNPCHVTSFMW